MKPAIAVLAMSSVIVVSMLVSCAFVTHTEVDEPSTASLEVQTEKAKETTDDLLLVAVAHYDDVPLTPKLQAVMQMACTKYDVPYSLALAVAECESSFNPDASNGICYGLMQINPINYSSLRAEGIEPTQHEGNIISGVRILGELLSKYGNTHKALMAYNCGESGASKLWNNGQFQSPYSEKVIKSQNKWQQIINER
ncbi:MAG: lytic transglycosylase domain-containing protein [Ruminococcus flavefaciens]|nr:lytic transglycosylase domain-containing protein [Ruminococcus flavefaciens]